MRRRIPALIVLTSAMVVSLAPAGFAGTAEQFTVPFNGNQVVPGPGDPDGAGGVFVALGTKTGSFCYFADTTNITTPVTSVRLNRGTRGQAGQMVAQVHGASNDPDTSGCFNFSRELVRDISKYRSNYYLEIQNEEFPGGALRAQFG